MMKKVWLSVAFTTLLILALAAFAFAAPESGTPGENLFSADAFLQSYFKEDSARPGTFTNGSVTTGSETFRTPGLTTHYTFSGHVNVVKIGDQPWNGIRIIIGASAAGTNKLVVTKAMDTRLEFKGQNVGDATYRAVSLPLADGTAFDFRVEREGSHVLFYLNDTLQADLTVDASLDTFDTDDGWNLGFEASDCHLEISDIVVICPDAQKQSAVEDTTADTTSESEETADMEMLRNTVIRLTATDALERTVGDVSGFRNDKYVGLFYFTWFNSPVAGQQEVYDITKIYHEDFDELFRTDSQKYPLIDIYYFNEPLYGYYSSTDEYIIRKHLELFIAADVDFIALDFTNAIYYGEAMQKMLDIYLEYQQAGWKVPQFMLFTNINSAAIITRAYKDFYSSGKYDSLWFRADGTKPYVIGREDELDESLRAYFSVRPPQWPNERFNENAWPYVDLKKPQPVYADGLMSASVSQHTGDAFSFSVKGKGGSQQMSRGRGFTVKTHKNGDVDAIVRGDNLQEEFDTAIKKDARILFVTGWNEWIAQKLSADWSDVAFWVDTFNTEFSRDIEMTKSAGYVPDGNGGYTEEGYGDNFYIQLMLNIRRFKGIPVEAERSDGAITYANIALTGYGRDAYGILPREDCYYTQDAPDNFVKSISVDHDRDSLFFTVNCESDITNLSADDTLNLLIGFSGSQADAWEHFNYRICGYSGGRALLMAAGADGWHAVGGTQVTYAASGSVLSLTIPRAAIGAEDGFDLYFKVTDSIEKPEEMLDYYVSGCSAPLGRLAYTYSVHEPESETDTTAAETETDTEPSVPDTEPVTPVTEPLTDADTVPAAQSEARSETQAESENGCRSMLAGAALTAVLAGGALALKKKQHT